MGVQLRVALPNQPGSLARVADAIARAGADVLSVTVLEAEAGRAIDEFRLRWPDARGTTSLVETVAALRGVEVLGARRTRWLLDGRPELDLIAALITAPDRAVETLVDMAPAAFDTDWAELRAPSRRLPALYTSGPVAHDAFAPEAMPVRAVAGEDGERAWAHFPVGALHCALTVGRDEGPAFLRAELVAAERVLDLALETIGRILRAEPVGAPTELTAAFAVGCGPSRRPARRAAAV